MATHAFTSNELRQRHDLAKPWAKIVSRRAFGDDGPELDVDFRTFERIAHAAPHGLTEGTLQLLLEQQAASRVSLDDHRVALRVALKVCPAETPQRKVLGTSCATGRVCWRD